MSEEWIRFREGAGETAVAKVSIEPSTVTARMEPIGSLLDIPLAWEWEGTIWRDKGYFWDIISIAAKLQWADKTKLISLCLPANIAYGTTPRNLVFPLTLTHVEEIEELRAASDASFLLTITAQMQLAARINLNRSGTIPPVNQVTIGIYQLQTIIPITVPKSVWEKNVQPNLGLDGLSSLTIIFPPGTQKIFAAPLYELQQAEKTLMTASTEEQFESVILQCRNAIDSLLNQFSFQLPTRDDDKPDASFGTRADALATQELKNVLSKSQAKAVCNILKDLWEPYSSAAKPGPAHHSRAFATFALQQAASVIKLVSDISRTKQQ